MKNAFTHKAVNRAAFELFELLLTNNSICVYAGILRYT